MASPSVSLSTLISLATSLSTSFSTIYQTSRPVVLTTLTFVNSQISTLTQPAVVMASTLAFPITVTSTISQVFTSIPSITPQILPSAPEPTSMAPSTSTIVTTSTLTSTFVAPSSSTITVYFTPAPTTSFYLTPPVITISSSTLYPATTLTIAEVIFVVEDVTGDVYSTVTRTLPTYPAYTSIVIVLGGEQHEEHGWNSWSDSHKGGLIAGVVLASLLILGILLWFCLRRRNIWLASEWMPGSGTVVQAVVPVQQQVGYPVNNGYWGPGYAGWGVRGGGGREKWWQKVSRMRDALKTWEWKHDTSEMAD